MSTGRGVNGTWLLARAGHERRRVCAQFSGLMVGDETLSLLDLSVQSGWAGGSPSACPGCPDAALATLPH